jgi:hypothetical protein
VDERDVRKSETGQRSSSGGVRGAGRKAVAEASRPAEVQVGADVDFYTPAAGYFGALEGNRSWMADSDGRGAR